MTETLGSYELLRLLGKGGMGEVHLARDARLRRDVALKVLPPEIARNAEHRSRFLREARAAAALNHPNITTVFEIGKAGERAFIALEFVEGRALNELLAERQLSPTELFSLATKLAEAIAYAHGHGVIHRDLKTSNVIITPEGVPKLLDFGLAKRTHDEDTGDVGESTTLTLLGEIIGTPAAMSPEQARGEPIDARSDIFSFGSMLYEMAAGRPAFLAGNVHETLDRVLNSNPDALHLWRDDLPRDFEELVAKAMRKDADERFGTMAEMLVALRLCAERLENPEAFEAEARGPTPLGWLAILFAVLLVLMSAYAALDWLSSMDTVGKPPG